MREIKIERATVRIDIIEVYFSQNKSKQKNYRSRIRPSPLEVYFGTCFWVARLTR